MVKPLFLAVVMLVFAAEALAEHPLRVPIKVRESAGIARTNEVVSVGVPFAAGAIHGEFCVALTDPEGRAVPVQGHPLCDWHPGAGHRWVLVQFPASAKANGTAGYRLEVAPGRESAQAGLSVEPTPEAIVVHTGVMDAAVSRKAWGLHLRGLSGDSVEAELYDAITVALDGTVHHANRPQAAYKVTVEERGPVRAVVKLEGDYLSSEDEILLSYVTRLYFFVNDTRVRVQHTFINWGKERFMIGDIRLLARVGGDQQTVGAFGLEHGEQVEGKLVPGESVWLLQDGGDRYSVTKRETGEWVERLGKYHVRPIACGAGFGRRAPGWAALSRGKGTLLCQVQDFWKLWPKELVVNADGTMEIALWPQRAADHVASYPQLDMDPPPIVWDGKEPKPVNYEAHTIHPYVSGFSAQNKAFFPNSGMAKTHEILLDLMPEWDVDDLAARAKSLDQPLVAAPDPEYIHAAKAIHNFYPRRPGRYEAAWRMLDEAFDWYCRYPDIFGYYGMLDYGDVPRMVWTEKWGFDLILKSHLRWAHPRGGWWNNHEKDLYQGFLLQWLRTNDPRYLREGIAAAYHSADVDTRWWRNSDGGYRCGQYAHCEGHCYRGWGAPTDPGLDIAHTWLVGLCYAYLITGDRRPFEAARGIADWLLDRAPKFSKIQTDMRTVAREIQGLAFFYEMTGEKKYLDAAMMVSKAAVEARKPDGSFGVGHWDWAPIFSAGVSHAVLEVFRITGDESLAVARLPVPVGQGLGQALREPIIGSLKWLITDPKTGRQYKPNEKGWVEDGSAGGVLGTQTLELMGDLYGLSGDESVVEWGRGSLARWQAQQDRSSDPRRRGNWWHGGATSYTWDIANSLIHVPAFLGYLDALDRAHGRDPVIYDTTRRE
jgi:hypothetical protein